MSQPEDFARDDIPAAGAPLAAADVRRATLATLALHFAAGPYAIGFDRWRGTITFERDGVRFDLYPFMLLQEGADRRRELAPFPEERRKAVAEAILKLWEEMVLDLYDLVATGRMRAVVREDSPKARYLTILPEGAFALFEVIDWEHGVAKCKYANEMIYNLHFRKIDDASQNADPSHLNQIDDKSPEAPIWIPATPPSGKSTPVSEAAASALSKLYPYGPPPLSEMRDDDLVDAVQRVCVGEIRPGKDTILRVARRKLWPSQSI